MSITTATLCRCFSLLLPLISFVHAQTCYISPNVQAPSDVVPCGTGTAACCQLGDTCLEDSACFNDASGVTYLYGCSDSSYTNEVCPWKCDYNSPYVGLVYCSANGTSNLWACTHPPDGDTVTANPSGQEQVCMADSQVAFAGPNPIPPVLILPSTVGGSTEYFSAVGTTYTTVDGYTPTPIPTVIASKPTAPEQVVQTLTTTSTTTTTTHSRTTTTSVTSRTTYVRPTTTSLQPTTIRTTTPSPTTSSPITTTLVTPITTTPSTALFTSSKTTSSSSAASSTAAGSSLSTGAKAGIGGGVAGGVLALAAVGLIFFFLRKRKQSHEPVPQNEVPYSPAEPKQSHYTDHPPGIPPVIGAGGPLMSTYDRSELPADVPNRYSVQKNGSQSELDSYSRFNSPAPTYTSWENFPNLGRQSPRPGHGTIHELS